jgi:hypothetical protein
MMRKIAIDSFPLEGDLSFVKGEEASDEVEKSRFPRPIRADETCDPIAFGSECTVGDCPDSTKRFIDPFHF